MEENRSPYEEYQKPEPGETPDPKPGNNRPRVWLIVVLIAAAVLIAAGGLTAGLLHQRDSEKQSSSSSEQVTDGGESSHAGITIEETPSETQVQPQQNERLSSVQVAEKMMPSVVGIVVYQQGNDGKETIYGSGSGVVMTEDGYILTCSHVVNDGDLTGRVEVLFTDGSKADGELIGYDTQTDLAVIKANKTGLTPAAFGDSNQLKVGEPVYVIGSPSGIEYLGSFAGGFVSAVNREIKVGTQKFKLACIQTDAAINPGNSGGPLINEYGQVVGINSAKLVSTNVEGMGFAIPSNTAQSVVASILESGYVTGRPKIGITFTSIDEQLADKVGIPHGIRVVGISEDCDVAKKDVKLGDIITKIDGEEVSELNEIAAILNRKQPGDSVTLTIYRVEESGKTRTFEVDVVLSEKTNG